MGVPAGFPWPAGTLTRGRLALGSSTIPIRPGCINHIFATASDPVEVDYGCGWVQSARCLVCDYVTPPLDAAWWSVKATEADLVTVIKEIDGERERLFHAALDIRNAMSLGRKPSLRNYD